MNVGQAITLALRTQRYYDLVTLYKEVGGIRILESLEPGEVLSVGQRTVIWNKVA